MIHIRQMAGLTPVAACLLAGCATAGPDYAAPPLPARIAEHAPAFAEGAAATFTSEPLPDHWWKLYEDPALDALVAEALAANTDLRVATANLERARAAAEQVRAAAGINGTMDASASLGEVSNLGYGSPAGVHGRFDAGLGISYELDVVGRIRRTIEAADANTEAQAAAYDLARTVVVGDVVAAYGDICASGARVAVASRSARLQRQSLALTERGVRAGLYRPVDMVRSRALVAQLEAAIPPIESRRRAALYSLAVLLGRDPRDFPPALASCTAIPAVRRAIPIGDGAALIRRRPDIRQAERRLAAATARIGVMTADLYPRISFGASLGTTSHSLAGLGDDASLRFSLGPLISWSFPDRRVARAGIAGADAEARAALAAFDGTILSALRETEVALGTYSRDLEENALLRTACDESRSVVMIERRKARGGLATGLEALDAERSLAAAEAALAQSDAVVAMDRTRLFLALGGGWEAT